MKPSASFVVHAAGAAALMLTTLLPATAHDGAEARLLPGV